MKFTTLFLALCSILFADGQTKGPIACDTGYNRTANAVWAVDSVKIVLVDEAFISKYQKLWAEYSKSENDRYFRAIDSAIEHARWVSSRYIYREVERGVEIEYRSGLIVKHEYVYTRPLNPFDFMKFVKAKMNANNPSLYPGSNK